MCSLQFLLVTRGAQIDATLCLLTTLSLYGLLRHLLLGPRWGWYFLGAAASGLGVVTKGVGFLPLLVLLPYLLGRKVAAQGLPVFSGGWRWLLAIPGFLLGASIWLVPMLTAVALHPSPGRLAYRNEILFHQTVDRYSAAWHHIEPWYYFLLNVIPGLWLPLSALFVWLAPRWFRDLRGREARELLLLGWVGLVLLFFSISAGKRGIYIFPALPAMVLAAAPHLPALYGLRSVQRTGLALAALVVLAAAGLCGAILVHAQGLAELRAELPDDIGVRLGVFVVAGLATWVYAFKRHPILAWPLTVGALAIVWSFLITPKMDSIRSGRGFMGRVESQVTPGAELGLLAYKEQFLLQSHRRTFNFGHARWREQASEIDDAARWLNGGARQLLVPESLLAPCFRDAPRQFLGAASGGEWWLVSPPALAGCAARGDPRHVFDYQLSSVRP
jgi:4-amino-4-deoxy-L-arabinose transferase-like glycosyltransferase